MNGPYDHVQPTEEQQAKLDMLRVAYKECNDRVAAILEKPGRDQSLAWTKLEESAMWASKAVTHG